MTCNVACTRSRNDGSETADWNDMIMIVSNLSYHLSSMLERFFFLLINTAKGKLWRTAMSGKAEMKYETEV